MFSSIKNIYQERKRYKKWRYRNPNNDTKPINNFCFDLVTVGDYTYGGLTVLAFGNQSKLQVGRFCSIASGVVFNLAGDHRVNTLSSFPFKVKCLKTEVYEAVSKGDIIVHDDVWMGQNSVIMSGVTIGQGAVVASGAVVTKNVPPYAIVGGVPAKVLKYRFSSDIIEVLKKVDYSKFTKEDIKNNLDKLYQPITSINQLIWLNEYQKNEE